MGFVVASHNMMHGVFLDALLDHYRQFTRLPGVDVFCLQENVVSGSDETDKTMLTHADRVAETLEHFQCVYQPEHPALATLVHRSLVVKESFLVALPRLDRLTWFERLYIRGGKVKQKYALATLLGKGSAELLVFNFHLDTAGSNQHRTGQVDAIARTLRERHPERRVVACGDTNAFGWSRSAGTTLVARIMEPLCVAANATLKGTAEATHYFARQREALMTHRLLTYLGKLGLDHPLPYDVICSNLTAHKCGKVTIDASDHDLVFAELDWP